MQKAFLLVSGILFSYLINVHAQFPDYKNYNIENGLECNEIFDIYQDSVGNIWMGSNEGIVKYDGEEFITYSNIEGIGRSFIFYIQPDAYGRIWFLSSSRGLVYYENGKIHLYKHNDKLRNYFGKAIIIIRSIWMDPNGDLYIGTLEKGIILIRADGTIESLTPKPIDVIKTFGLYQYSSKQLFYTIFSENNNKEYNFCVFNNNKNQEIFREKSKYINNLYICARKNGELLITLSHYVIRMKNDKLIKITEHANEIISVYEDRDSNIWFGYYSTGVKKFDKNSSFEETETAEHYFDKLSITKALQDKDGNFWFTSLEKGVFYIPDIHIKTLFDYTNQLQDYYITKIRKIKNELWIGTVKGELFKYSNDSIMAMKIEKDAGIIISILNKDDNIQITGSKKSFYISNNPVRKNNSANIHLSISDHSGNRYECIHKKIYMVTIDFDTIWMENPSIQKFNTLFCDSKNRVWAATSNYIFRIKNGKLNEFVLPVFKPNVRDIAEANGRFFLASASHGILVLSPDSARYINTFNGLPSDVVERILIQDDKILWAATSKGLCKIRLEDLQIEMIINNKKGLPASEVKMLELINDTLYVGSHNYISFFNTRLVHPNKINHPTVIKKIWVNNRELSDTSRKVFDYNENNFEFNIHSYIYGQQGNIEYKYRLLGVSDQFSHTTGSTIHYAYLSPGTYTFEAFALNEEKRPASIPLKYTFTIGKPFWKTIWFYAISFAILIIIVVLVTWFYSKRKNASRDMQLQLLESKQQAFANQMNPHFIFNALNSIQTFILVENKIEAAEYLSKFSKLMRLTLQNIRESWVSLQSEITLISYYLDLEKVRYPNISYQIEVDDSIETLTTYIPSMLIQPFIENAIKHGIAIKKDLQGHIHIRFIKEDDTIYCEVKDDGVGMDIPGRSGKQSEHISTGIDITSARLKLICDSMKMPYSFNISSVNNDQNNIGTLVRFAVPNKQHI